MRLLTLLGGLGLVFLCDLCKAFSPCHRAPTTPREIMVRRYLSDQNDERDKGPLDFLFNPYSSKIPKELEEDIYAAEGRTQTAQGRNTRIALYAAVAFVGILLAFFNGFITGLRTGETPDGVILSLDETGFGWVESNFLFRFLFMNKIGGGLCLLGGGAAGLLAEAEYDTRRINAEKIFEEMKRRRNEKAKKGNKKKKKRSGKELKRLGALAEIVVEEENEATLPSAESGDPQRAMSVNKTEPQEDKEGGGILDTVKGFYDRADNMAASQALLLNKKLEEAGVVDKITDESGLKVIGKEAAKKITEGEKEKNSNGRDSTEGWLDHH